MQLFSKENPAITYESLSEYEKSVDARLLTKVNKKEGMDLSHNDLTDELKDQITTNKEDISTLTNGKVDKDGNKGLSANDYSDEEKAQVAQNKTDIEGLKSSLQSANETLAKKADTKDLESLKTEVQQNVSTQLEDLSGKVENLSDSVSGMASKETPEEPKENMVWFDLNEKVVKVYSEGQWIKFGAVYQ